MTNNDTDNTGTPFEQPSAARGASTDPESGGNAAYTFDGKPDRWKRYRLPHPDTGKADGFTRATTFAKSISDTYTLSMWSQRMVGIGLAMRPDLLMAVASTPPSDRDTLNGLVEDAKNAAGAKVGANLGSAIHAFTEMVDRGETPNIPTPYRPHIAAWSALLEEYGLEVIDIERVVLCAEYDHKGVAGTLDRIVRFTRDVTVEVAGGVQHTFREGTVAILDLKGLALDTPIPTPDGWTTMEKVQPGDQVIGADGRPCSVTAKSGIKRIGTYVVRFDDGSEIVCDSEHLWQTTIGHRCKQTTVRGIEEIAATVKDRRGQNQHRIPVAGPLELPHAELPIDPYVLGCWLGDGAVRGGEITKQDDLFEILQRDGHALGVRQVDSRSGAITRTVLGLRTLLIEHGLVHAKHIPSAYLRSSWQQRLRLLQGLMDTDGTWNTARRTAVFSTCDPSLARQVEELMLTLGQRPHTTYFKRKGFGLEVDSWTVEITPVGINPFRLPRKASQAAASSKSTVRSSQRVIVSVKPGPDVETACIAVDSPDRLYLCGERMIPTHNTGKDLEYGWLEIAVQLAVYARAKHRWDKTELRWLPQIEGMDTGVALVVHIPATAPGETVEASMYAVDISAGHETARLCTEVRDVRKRKGWATKLSVVRETAISAVVDGEVEMKKARAITAPVEPEWAEKIAAAKTEADLADIWMAAMSKRAEKGIAGLVKARHEQILADTAAG